MTGIEVLDSEPEATMTIPAASAPTPNAAATRRPAARKTAKKATNAGAHGNVMTSVRLTRDQIRQVERWRSLYGGLDLGTALRALVALGLSARPPREVVDPLMVESATHRRLKSRKSS